MASPDQNKQQQGLRLCRVELERADRRGRDVPALVLVVQRCRCRRRRVADEANRQGGQGQIQPAQADGREGHTTPRRTATPTPASRLRAKGSVGGEIAGHHGCRCHESGLGQADHAGRAGDHDVREKMTAAHIPETTRPTQ